MTKIRELFHKVGNWHNKISVGAGVAKAELKHKYKDKPFPQEIGQVMSRLTELERHAVEASKSLNQLKDMVYSVMDIDTGKPKN